ncbi:MAG: hypothetical protein M0R33_17305 [Methylomonas sp.]|jgi:hypothetical protein|uniref:hypothetical protein n=1 Tax=Methylomonas sp. TaxID=418 RepID=UPI0025E4BF97|nr:hypothetical protein [Methylomonas sp.]MCK9608205.1 hypothetical protein [Methylomonas sp.]
MILSVCGYLSHLGEIGGSRYESVVESQTRKLGDGVPENDAETLLRKEHSDALHELINFVAIIEHGQKIERVHRRHFTAIVELFPESIREEISHFLEREVRTEVEWINTHDAEEKQRLLIEKNPGITPERLRRLEFLETQRKYFGNQPKE